MRLILLGDCARAAVKAIMIRNAERKGTERITTKGTGPDFGR
jgi:hypothetical protein